MACSSQEQFDTPAGYYAWRNWPENPRKTANRVLLTELQRLHIAHRRRYGAPSVHAALRAEGHAAGRGHVARLMRHHDIRAITPRRFRVCTTDSHHDLRIAPNRLDQKFAALKTGDLTYCEWVLFGP
jgi:putative transposase